MRTLLRNTATGLFFQGPDKWTTDPAEALDFKMIDRALEFVETWSLKDMELAFAFRGAHRSPACLWRGSPSATPRSEQSGCAPWPEGIKNPAIAVCDLSAEPGCYLWNKRAAFGFQ